MLNGQQRPMGEAFDAGGIPIRYPGDPMAPIEETINCRCALTMRVVPVATAKSALYPFRLRFAA